MNSIKKRLNGGDLRSIGERVSVFEFIAQLFSFQTSIIISILPSLCRHHPGLHRQIENE